MLDEVGAPNAFVQYDIYHAQRTEGELAATLAQHLARAMCARRGSQQAHNTVQCQIMPCGKCIHMHGYRAN